MLDIILDVISRLAKNGLRSICIVPRAPVHIVTGSAGCQEGRDRFYHNPYKWSAFRSQDYGYTRFTAHNLTHLYMEQVSVDLKGKVIDSFWLVKTKLSFNMP